jgi:sodium-dependent dicarboxylate transporter 2/3/5
MGEKPTGRNQRMPKPGNGVETRSLIYIGIAVALMLLVGLVPLPESMTQLEDAELTGGGRVALAVLVFALVMWMTEALPFHVTGMISVFLLAVLGVDSFSNIVQIGFGNHIIAFFIGVLVLSAFITRSGLGKRISVFMLSKTGNRTSMIILGFLVVGALLSMWITNVAVAAMLMPLARAVLQEEGVEPLKSNFGRALMLSAAWGPTVGGIATPSGAGPNPLAIGFLKSMAGVDVSFLDWMLYGLPAALLLLLPAWGILLLFFKPEMSHLSRTREELQAEYREMPAFSRIEKVTLVIFILTVALWLTTPLFESLLDMSIPISMPVLLTASLFFLPGAGRIKWKEIEREVSWSSILLIVTGISLGMMLFETGAANWLAVGLLGGIGGLGSYVQVFAVVLLVSLLKIVFSSNTVTATIIIPIMIALTVNLGVDTLTIVLPAALTSSMAFILVTSSPTNVIPYSAGYFSIKDMAVSGLALTVLASVIVATTIFVIGSITGIY